MWPNRVYRRTQLRRRPIACFTHRQSKRQQQIYYRHGSDHFCWTRRRPVRNCAPTSLIFNINLKANPISWKYGWSRRFADDVCAFREQDVWPPKVPQKHLWLIQERSTTIQVMGPIQRIPAICLTSPEYQYDGDSEWNMSERPSSPDIWVWLDLHALYYHPNPVCHAALTAYIARNLSRDRHWTDPSLTWQLQRLQACDQRCSRTSS